MPTDDPVSILIEEPCPIRRSKAHTTLGQRALAGGDLSRASEHLIEAIDLDPTDEEPKQLLHQLERKSTPGAGSSRRKRSWWPF